MRGISIRALATLLGLAGTTAVVLAVAVGASAAGCDTSWQSPVSGSWTDASKWSNGVPSSPSAACITVSGAYTVTLTGSQHVASLTLGGGSDGQTLAVSASFADNTGPGNATLTASGDITNSARLELTDPDPTTQSTNAIAGVTVSGTLTNDGTIVSDPGPDGQGSRSLEGTITNASGATLTVNQSLCVNCNTTAPLTTGGSINVAAGQQLVIDNTGTPGTFSVTGGAIDDQGAIDDHTSNPTNNGNGQGGTATLNVSGGTLSGNPIDGVNVAVSLSGAGHATVELWGANNTLATDVPAGETLILASSTNCCFVANTTLTTSTAITNDGTIELTNDDPAGTQSSGTTTLDATAGAITNHGTIASESGTAGLGGRAIDGAITNASDGTVAVNQSLCVDCNSTATFTTGGAINVAPGERLRVDDTGSPGTFDVTGGAIADQGSIDDHTSDPANQGNGQGGTATLHVSGGTISGHAIAAYNAAVSLAGTGDETLHLWGSGNTLSSDVPASYALVLDSATACCFVANTTLTTSSDVANHGTITLTNDDPGGTSNSGTTALNATSGTITNDGTILSSPGTAGLGARTIDGNLINAVGAALTVNQSLCLDCNTTATFTNRGALTVLAGHQLSIDNTGSPGTVALAGGTITDQGAIYDHSPGPNANALQGLATLTVTGGSLTGQPITAVNVAGNFTGSGGGTFRLGGSSNTVSGDIASGYTLIAYALDANGFGDADITAAGGATNHGTIELLNASPSGSYPRNAALTISAGTLTNDGTIAAEPGLAGQGTRTITGAVANDATFAVDQTVLYPNGQLANAGEVMVANGQTLNVPGTYTQPAGTTNLGGATATLAATGGTALQGGTLSGAGTVDGSLVNGGQVTPGASPATIDVTGDYTQQPSGFLSAQITSSGNDQLHVTGTASLDGTLAVSSASDFHPGTGQTFTVLQAGTVSGTFTTVTGLDGGPYSVTYHAADVTLTGLAATLTTSVAGTGSGALTSSPAGIDCPGTCSHGFDAGTTVTLTATPAAGSTFTGWSGAGCSGAGTCTVTMNADAAVTATFSAPTTSPALTVTIAGAGTGSVSSSPAGISCPGTCSHGFASGTTVTLSPAAAAGSTFTGWNGGGCSGTGTCTILLSSDTTVTATFDAAPSLSITDVTVARPASGSVTATFTVSLSSAQGSPITVTYATANGTAVAGQDYTAASGLLTFAPGVTQQTISVTVLGAATPGPDRTFFVDLSDPSGASLALNRATGTILNEAIALTAVDPATAGNDGTATVTVAGAGFAGRLRAQLTGGGHPTITASSVDPASDGRGLTATFDLTGAATGTRDVVLTNAAGRSASIHHGFSIIAATEPQVTAGLAGPAATGPGTMWTGLVDYQNLGNVDAYGALIEISGFPQGTDVHVDGGDGPPVVADLSGQRTVTVGIRRIGPFTSGAVGVSFLARGQVHHFAYLQVRVIQPSRSPAPGTDQPVSVSSTITANTATHFAGTLHLASPAASGDVPFDLSLVSAPPDGQTHISSHTSGGVTTIRSLVPMPPAPADFGSRLGVTFHTGPAELPALAGAPSAPLAAAALGDPPARSAFEAPHWLLDIIGATRTSFGLAKDAAYGVDTINQVSESKRLSKCLADKGFISSSAKDSFGAPSGQTILDDAANVETDVLIGSLVADVALKPGIGSYVATQGSNALGAAATSGWAFNLYQILSTNGKGGGLVANNDYAGTLANVINACPPPPPPPPPPPYPVELRVSGDPNDMIGPGGAGARHWLRGADRTPYTYTTLFENRPDASAPAYRVRISDPLDPSTLDLSTLSLGTVRFAGHVVTPPARVQSWSTQVDLRPDRNELVDIAGHLDRATHLLTWQFTTIDAATGRPVTDAVNGFLPPDTKPPDGEGSVSFAVKPRAGLATGARIRNRATIVFDLNAPIDTPVWSNAIDRTAPRSRVRGVVATARTVPFAVRGKLRRRRHAALLVRWRGTDRGSGVAGFSIYGALSGGPLRLVGQTRGRQMAFACTPHRRYRFSVVAHDGAGNAQRGRPRPTRPVPCAA